MPEKSDYGPIFWLHVISLLLAYSSPFWLDWKLILAGVIVLQIQYFLLGGCILTHWQMGSDKNETFIWYYLQKLSINVDPKKVKFIIRAVVPIVILLIALFYQEV